MNHNVDPRLVTRHLKNTNAPLVYTGSASAFEKPKAALYTSILRLVNGIRKTYKILDDYEITAQGHNDRASNPPRGEAWWDIT